MGLLGDTIDSVVDAAEGTVDAVTGVYDTAESVTETADNVVDTVTGTENSVNEGVQEVTNDAGEVADQESDGIFSMVQSGFEGIEGLFQAVSGGFEWAKGLADLTRGINSNFANIWEFLMGGLAGVFANAAVVPAAIAGVLGWAESLGAWEGVGAFFAVVLMFLGGYMLFSSLGLQAFESTLTFTMGFGLLYWTQHNVQGAALIALMGVALITLGMIADRQSWLVFGVLFYIPGVPLFFAALKLGFIANFLFTAGALVVLTFGLDYLETELAPGLALDEARGPGLFEVDRYVAEKVSGGAKRAASRVKGSGA